MKYTVRRGAVLVGVVDLPSGSLVAGRLDVLPSYADIRDTVKRATEAFLDVGLFGDATEPDAPSSPGASRRRAAMAEAARLHLELLGADGEQIATTFVNLIEAPADGVVVVLAHFAESPTPVGAFRAGPARQGGGQGLG